jgi:hypothetical protein
MLPRPSQGASASRAAAAASTPRFAYVTLVSDERTARLAQVMLRGMRAAGARYPLVVMVPSSVPTDEDGGAGHGQDGAGAALERSDGSGQGGAGQGQSAGSQSTQGAAQDVPAEEEGAPQRERVRPRAHQQRRLPHSS